MFNSIRNRSIRNTLAAIITLLIATACSTTNLVREEHGITIERIDSDKATISNAYLIRDDGQLVLRGEIRRRPIGRGFIPGHLHVALIDEQGNVIKEADISYMRKSTKSSSATFKTKIPLEVKPWSTIQVTHFKTDTHSPIPKGTVWRDGN